ncbi:MAG: carboxylate-amine ligase [Proteobacteria bacterium]|nr:MAG: carboxylate-amine ligase [Pseudomonadota bacterium]
MRTLQAMGYTFGIEEEYFLCDAQTRLLAGEVSPQLLVAARERMGDAATTELLQSQIEIASPVFSDAAQALAVLRRFRRELSEVAKPHGLRLVGASTHPLGDWGAQHVTGRPRYERVLADFRILGQRNLICGMHVHVAVPEGCDRVQLMNRVLPFLPLFLSLSASSPFWHRRYTGLASYRQSLYDEWPRSGVPDFFDDEADYFAFADLLRDTGAAPDASYLWWAIRPSLSYPTLELRIADLCTRVQEGVAIACLYRCLVAALVDRPTLSPPRTSHTRRVIDENRWRAKRDGIGAEFIDEASRSLVPARAQLARLREQLAPEIERFDCASQFDELDAILERGTSANAQLRVYNDARATGVGRREALCRVVDWLVETTVA